MTLISRHKFVPEPLNPRCCSLCGRRKETHQGEGDKK